MFKNLNPTLLLLNICRVLLIAAFAISLVSVLHPDVRSQIRGAFVHDFRTIVSTARGDLLGNGTQLTVVKVKTQNSLGLEVYQAEADGSNRLLEHIELPDKKDGYFNFNGQATNLAIDDVDGDGRPEIVAPSFDQNLVGRLNIYKFKAESNSFERMIR
jgi:hypothetical protein